jgi:hypothetical protein
MKQSIVYLALMFAACAPLGDAAVRETTQNGISVNGISVNGTSMNGTSLAGANLNGTTLVAVNAVGATPSGAPIAANVSAAPPLSGGTLVGSTWNGTASNGASVALRVDRAERGTGDNQDLWFYAVSYRTQSGWSPLCGVDSAGLPVLAVSAQGTWTTNGSDTAYYAADSTAFTLSCRGRTIAKCVELGYKPYDGYTAELASCVRLLRGDFCGSGAAYTVDGNTLNMYDGVGVQADTEAWTPEAEWTPAGARCINSNNAARYELAVAKDPKCIKILMSSDCGAGFSRGAVLIDELPPR